MDNQDIPQSDVNEMACIGACIVGQSNRIIDEVHAIVEPADFFAERHRQLFEIILGLRDHYRLVDTVLLRDEMDRRGLREQLGGWDYIFQCTETVASEVNAPYYARIVKYYALLRTVIKVCGNISNEARGKPEDLQEFLGQIMIQMQGVVKDNDPPATLPIEEIMEGAMDELLNRNDEGLSSAAIQTGFVSLDAALGGLHRGEVTVIAGRPSMGKSSLALNIAENQIEKNRRTMLFSLEMSRNAVVQRLVCSQAGVSLWSARQKFVSSYDQKRLNEAADHLKTLPFIVNDSANLTPGHALLAARHFSNQRRLDLIVIDYLQLMTCPGYREKRLEIGAISRQAKALARELKVPVIMVSQLNRAAENRTDHRPHLADLRETGDIEQDADVVLLLYREDYYGPGKKADYQYNGEVEVIIGKQRHGPTQTVTLHWCPDLMKMEEEAGAHVPEP